VEGEIDDRLFASEISLPGMINVSSCRLSLEDLKLDLLSLLKGKEGRENIEGCFGIGLESFNT